MDLRDGAAEIGSAVRVTGQVFTAIILTDRKIRKLGSILLKPFNEDAVQAIGYDLTVEVFCAGGEKTADKVKLGPLESVFVQCEEIITLPANMAAFITLRNSRIQQGLLLTAPVYQPGHKTPVYFRVTNVSTETIALNAGEGIASILFEELGEDVLQPYSGAFQNELEYRGMSYYADIYRG